MNRRSIIAGSNGGQRSRCDASHRLLSLAAMRLAALLATPTSTYIFHLVICRAETRHNGLRAEAMPAQMAGWRTVDRAIHTRLASAHWRADAVCKRAFCASTWQFCGLDPFLHLASPFCACLPPRRAGFHSLLNSCQPSARARRRASTEYWSQSMPPASGFGALQLILSISAAYLNLVLYTCELVLAVRYLRRKHPTPPRPMHKAAVILLLLSDTASTFTFCFTGIRTALNGPLPEILPRNIGRFFGPFAVVITTTYLSGAIEQLFLCNLFFVLTRNRPVSLLLLLMTAVHLGFAWATGIVAAVRQSTQGVALMTASVGAIMCAATDIVIAVGLGWKFLAMMRDTPEEHSIRTLLYRILMLTVCSGALVAGNTLIAMILLLNHSLAFTFFFTCQGRVYALTLLGNFLIGIPAQRRRVGPPTINVGTGSHSLPIFRTTAGDGDDHFDTELSPTPTAARHGDPDRKFAPAGAPTLPYITAQAATSHSLHLPGMSSVDNSSSGSDSTPSAHTKSKAASSGRSSGSLDHER
ncbi:hypothetical protein MIND_00916400 [Mycena indigotica]|uniref:DUF6534 domain-containing protein n=1 Tax=Mycena indigotica TaxID=2126181 RepID=A0A8H6VYU3_9AGAR|nr:uncharacterized protein MIND_00916400 [Mycena indigotica]KAF7296851.1 hypothetical protein MIND_00916400 [Mycena indigotica]